MTPEAVREVNVEFKDPNAKINAIPKDNPLTVFNNSLTEDERDRPIGELSKDKIIAYIKAVAELYQMAITDEFLRAGKMQNLLAMAFAKYNFEHLEIGIDFVGSKHEVKEEKIKFILEKSDRASVKRAPSELAHPDSEEPKIKISSLLEDNKAIFGLYTVAQTIFKDNDDSAKVVAQIMVICEFVSKINIQNYESSLENPYVEGQEVEKAFYNLEVTREEVLYPMVRNGSKLKH